MKELGYVYRGSQGVAGRIFYVKGPESMRIHHLNLTQEGSGFWRDHLLFRDYLRRNVKARDRYRQKKIKLAEKYADDRPRYTELKAELVRQILKEAKKEKG